MSTEHNSKHDRTTLEAHLAARKYQRSAMNVEIDRFIQTHQDATAAAEQLASLDAEILKLERDLESMKSA
jgi:hypothetical protein